jgi:hypothetical protein
MEALQIQTLVPIELGALTVRAVSRAPRTVTPGTMRRPSLQVFCETTHFDFLR